MRKSISDWRRNSFPDTVVIWGGHGHRQVSKAHTGQMIFFYFLSYAPKCFAFVPRILSWSAELLRSFKPLSENHFEYVTTNEILFQQCNHQTQIVQK